MSVLPWYENPFRLISWWEMNKFSAESFCQLGFHFGTVGLALRSLHQLPPNTFPDLTAENIHLWVLQMRAQCQKIGLVESAKAASRIVSDLSTHPIPSAILGEKIEAFAKLITSEMESQLFLWVPGHRSEWYSKDAVAILGIECCHRFKSIQREVEEAAKCYAFGLYTASAFHLMRSTEAGVRALARAIKYTPPHDMWDLVFKHVQAEFNTKPSLRPAHWQTHGDFLETVWGDLRAVSKAWRNDIAHLVDTYTESEAKGLLDVIPLFLCHLATRMDEDGILY